MAGKRKNKPAWNKPNSQPKRRSARRDKEAANAYEEYESKLWSSSIRKSNKTKCSSTRNKSPTQRRRSPRHAAEGEMKLQTPPTSRSTRSQLPFAYCELYGEDRIQRYHQYLMCHNCDINEATAKTHSGRRDRNRFSKRMVPRIVKSTPPLGLTRVDDSDSELEFADNDNESEVEQQNENDLHSQLRDFECKLQEFESVKKPTWRVSLKKKRERPRE